MMLVLVCSLELELSCGIKDNDVSSWESSSSSELFFISQEEARVSAVVVPSFN